MCRQVVEHIKYYVGLVIVIIAWIWYQNFIKNKKLAIIAIVIPVKVERLTIAIPFTVIGFSYLIVYPFIAKLAGVTTQVTLT